MKQSNEQEPESQQTDLDKLEGPVMLNYINNATAKKLNESNINKPFAEWATEVPMPDVETTNIVGDFKLGIIDSGIDPNQLELPGFERKGKEDSLRIRSVSRKGEEISSRKVVERAPQKSSKKETIHRLYAVPDLDEPETPDQIDDDMLKRVEKLRSGLNQFTVDNLISDPHADVPSETLLAFIKKLFIDGKDEEMLGYLEDKYAITCLRHGIDQAREELLREVVKSVRPLLRYFLKNWIKEILKRHGLEWVSELFFG